MKTRTIITILLLAVTATAISGCAVALVGAGAAAGVGYVRGDLEAQMDESIDNVYNASLKALEELELAIISKDKNALGAKIISRTTEDKKIQIKLKRTENNITKLTIRIGLFGDETQSRVIYDTIKKNL